MVRSKGKRGKKQRQGDLFADKIASAPEAPLSANPAYLKSKEHLFVSEPIKGKGRRIALEWARARGDYGYTLSEVLDAFDEWGKQDEGSVSSGAVDLAFANLVTDSGRSRDHRGGFETVWVAVETEWWKRPETTKADEGKPCSPDAADAAASTTPSQPPLTASASTVKEKPIATEN